MLIALDHQVLKQDCDEPNFKTQLGGNIIRYKNHLEINHSERLEISLNSALRTRKSGKEYYKCDICGKTKPNKDRFKTHWIKAHSDNSLFVLIPVHKENFEDIIESIILKENDHEQICKMCGTIEKSRADIIRHVETYHLSGISFKCEVCQEYSKTRRGLRAHLHKYCRTDASFKDIGDIVKFSCVTKPYVRKHWKLVRKHKTNIKL